MEMISSNSLSILQDSCFYLQLIDVKTEIQKYLKTTQWHTVGKWSLGSDSCHLQRSPSCYPSSLFPRETEGNGKKLQSQLTETTQVSTVSSSWLVQEDFSSAWMFLWLNTPSLLPDLCYLSLTLTTSCDIWFQLCPLASANRLSGFHPYLWRLLLSLPQTTFSQPSWISLSFFHALGSCALNTSMLL